jgi:PAS domain S-box-containing protein
MAETIPGDEPRRLADFLRQRHDQILERWERDVSRLRPAKFLSRPALLDHIPDFLRQLADFVSASRDRHSTVLPQQFPIVHAIERLDVGYDLDEVVSEYAILRECISTLAQAEASPSLLSAELPRLHNALDLAIAASVERYSKTRERTLKALDRISTAALGVREIEGFLPKTLAALLETTPSIDSASILLIENGRLRVRASAGLAASPQNAPSLGRGECFAGRVWDAGQPQAIRDAQSDLAVTTDIIQRRGTRAMYGVPLHFGTELIGVAMMGSSTTYQFSHDDLLLFRTAASRVAALIAHARLDEAVRRQSATHESILSALGDLGEGFAILEEERVVEVNDALCRIVGRSQDEIRALPSMIELIATEQRESLRERLSHRFVADSAQGGLVEAALVHKAGHDVEVELGVKRKATGRVVLLVRDVTDRKALERERADQRARLETVLRILPVGIVIAEAPSGKLVLGNEEAQRLWGRGMDETSVESYGVYEGYWPDGRRVAKNEWPLTRAVRDGETTAGEEIHVIRADGTKRITEMKAAPVRDAKGAVVAGVVTLVDVTDRKRSEEELRAALVFRDQILNILAHDLRQPLSVVVTSAEMLLRNEALKGYQPILSRQIRNLNRMDRMIRDLLDYARARRGSGLPIERKQTDLRTVLRHAVESIEIVHPGREIVVGSEGDTTGLFDADRMLQAFVNLIENAVAYSPKETPIGVTLEEDSGAVVARVHNLGDPIPPERLATIFEPFRRGTSPGNPGGLGLGLFIVQQIVTAHGGTVEVTSTGEGGTTFALRLPKS